MAMDVTELNDVAKNDMMSVQRNDQKTRVPCDPTETELSFSLIFWKVNLKGFFRRVTGRSS